jgi:hypothetical protein
MLGEIKLILIESKRAYKIALESKFSLKSVDYRTNRM